MVKKEVGRDKKINTGTYRKRKGTYVIKRGVPQPGITKKEFMGLLEKVSQPVEHEKQSDLEKPET